MRHDFVLLWRPELPGVYCLPERFRRDYLFAAGILVQKSPLHWYTGTEKSSMVLAGAILSRVSLRSRFTHTHTHTLFILFFSFRRDNLFAEGTHTHKYIHTHTHTHTVSMAGARGERQGHGRPPSTKTLNPKLNPKLNQAREEREARARHANLGQNRSRMLRGADRAPNQRSRRELQ